ncbi:hypothetical protein EV361DRAFT_956320 [Lentinula raphanica]|uniref:Uncharacterized protein n=1 Tax=Lentinula raphanica TaxID=153919 RepID=A0AA38UA55_9AGAR|nr:hypothetical protein F5878DRAFT_647456 [Lentinula raphanica]KAJ3964068.1 hypothetical protein EV361DRAFT_956320 [Lentinula raphanica]
MPMNGNTQHTDNESATSEEAMEAQESPTATSPGGWGLSNTGWHRGWGSAPATEQNRESHISRSTALRNLRSDFIHANLTFAGNHQRDTALDSLDAKLWASVQSYRSSDEARKGSSPYPTFTGPQVLQRLEEVKALLNSHILEQQSLTNEIIEASNSLSSLRARKKQVSKEVDALRDAQRELEDLREIAVARLM